MSELPFITVAEEDYNRLSTLLERMAGKSDVADGLEDELSRAELVPLAEMPEGVVTMKDRKSTRLNSSHVRISYAVFCLKKKRRGDQGMALHGGVAPVVRGRHRPELRDRRAHRL